MITFTQGNLLEARAQALVNTVNTVGIMGKGVALMFKDRFNDNFQKYAIACKAGQVKTGEMFVTELAELDGPRWIINFPTKQHWRAPSQLKWITEGLQDLRIFLLENKVQSVALPPLGAGNGGLDWVDVRREIEKSLGDLNLEVIVYEPATTYQNVAKRAGIQALTPARALIAELVRRYWVLGMECSLLEIQKLAWFLEQAIERLQPSENPLSLQFKAYKYGPFAPRLNHLLNHLDGSYLHSAKRIADAEPFDVIWFDDSRKDMVQAYLYSEAKLYKQALEDTAALIEGFESPYGLELLATVDWLVTCEGVGRTPKAVIEGLKAWPEPGAAQRKIKLFNERSIAIALDRLNNPPRQQITAQTCATFA